MSMRKKIRKKWTEVKTNWEEIPKGEDSITKRMIVWKYSKEHKEELKLLLADGMEVADILKFYYPETSVEQMNEIRKTFESIYIKNNYAVN